MESIETNRNLLLRLADIWWAGVKVFLRWCSFYIVLTVLWLPPMGLAYLAGERAGRILGVAMIILWGPITFYLASRYLHLLREDDNDSVPQEGPPPVTETGANKMRTKINVSMLVAFFISALLLSPPDHLSQLFNGVAAALLCGIPLVVLARLGFVKSASSSMQGLVAALVCIVAVLLLACFLFMQMIISREKVSNHPAQRQTVAAKYVHEHARHPWSEDNSPG